METKFQIGRAGLTEGVIQSLGLALKTHKQIRISVLKSTSRNKSTVREMAENLVEKLPYKCSYKVIGFTIILKKLSGVRK